ncbi:SusC/RagA family TonB-linked outer membrane protein [Pedobacter sp. SYSU D00535]|uniref:SusC/RagA family TonB-linked outer membrane protein n=1 Tax=Pedobacter sp. SYSU D00535 TaxID=2810308 RepID=UPI001F604EF3|nr:SusC/RagA family TonB-linked outer membrane protein [Pedobacter sp. SYSU D00535]
MKKHLKKLFYHTIPIMKFSLLVFTVIAVLSGSLMANKTRAQQLNQVRLRLENRPGTLDELLQELQQKSGFMIMYNSRDLGGERPLPFTLPRNEQSLKQILDLLSREMPISYRQSGENIYVRRKAQPGSIRGSVTDESGESLPGASVRVKGTNKGTMTNMQGTYVLSLEPGNYTLVVSYIGYQSREYPVTVAEGSDQELNVSLKAMAQLKEVVVSYGQQRRAEITGAIAQVDAEDLQDQPVGQFAQQLQGRIAGVQINQYSGQPGRGIEFRIRGAASLFADNQPLVVIDGIPVTGSINNINPAEIESFTVLKDASSTALYGSRAANGVILITTRHAKAGESKVEFNSFYGIQKIPEGRIPKMMTAREFAEFQNEYYEDRVKYENYKGTLDPVYQNPERYGEGTNWFNTLTETNPIQKYDLIVSSARERSSSTIIAGYLNHQGVVLNTGTQLFSLRLNQDLRLNNDRIKLGFNIAPSYRIDHNNRLSTDGLNGLMEKVVEASPLISPVNPDGTMPLYVNSPGMVTNLNPYAQFLQTKDDYKTTRILGNAYLNYEFLKGLSLKTNFAVDKGAETRNRFVPSTIVANGIASGLSSAVDNYSWTAEANLHYNKTFFDYHHVEALVGYSAQKFDQESNSVTGTNFPNDDVEWISAATAISEGSSNTTHYSLISQIARLNYNFKRKYLLSGAVRRDGSSRFGSNRKYGYFPSVAAGWVLSEEPFMDRFTKLDLLKLRASYGITGNNSIGNYTFIPNTGSYNYVFGNQLTPGISISNLGNVDLAWERNKQFNIGADLSILDNRVSFTYDYYDKISDGLIMDMPIPRASGFTTIKSNVGVLELWGHELSLNTVNLTGKLKWNSSFNMSFDRNRIKSLVNPGFLRRNNTTSSDYYRHQEGRSLGEFYGFVFEGLYKDEQDLANSPKLQISGLKSAVGTVKMKDVNGDGFITNDDRTFIGNPTPDFNFGFFNDFRYKNFDLNIAMAGSVGGKIMNPGKWAYLANLDGARMMLAATKDRWRSPENPGSGVYPRTMSGTTGLGRSVNTQWIEDVSYLTAKNISLGYTVPLKNSKTLSNLRIYASVQQAFTISNYSGMNPEVNVGGMDPSKGLGIDENAYPVPRTFSLGINTTFR